MRQLIIIISIISITSCSWNNFVDSEIFSHLEPIQLYDYAEYDLTEITTYREIALFNRSLINYQTESGEKMTSPKDTINLGFGDCDEYALMFMNVAYLTQDVKMSFVMINLERSVVSGGNGNHYDVMYEGVVYSAQTGRVSEQQEILYSYTFDEVFGE